MSFLLQKRFLYFLFVLSFIFGNKALGLPYTLEVGEGTNKAHSGTWTVDVSYDKDTKKVKFKVVKGPDKKSQDTWNGWTWSIDATESSGVVTFNGTSDDPTDKDGKTQKNQKMDFKNGKIITEGGTLTLESVKPTGGGDYGISNIKLVPAPSSDAKDNKKADSKISNSVDFSSLSNKLTISNSKIVGTPDPLDPLLGADIKYPEFTLSGYSSSAGAFVFVNNDIGSRISFGNSSSDLQSAAISGLMYDVASNMFHGVLFDLQSIPGYSQFIDYVNDNFLKGSSLYDPTAMYVTTILPDENFLTITNSFKKSAETSGSDGHYIVPAPLPIFAVGVGFSYSRRIRRRIKSK